MSKLAETLERVASLEVALAAAETQLKRLTDALVAKERTIMALEDELRAAHCRRAGGRP